MREILRLKQALSNKAIAKATSISVSTVANLTAGKIKKPNIKVDHYVNKQVQLYLLTIKQGLPTS